MTSYFLNMSTKSQYIFFFLEIIYINFIFYRNKNKYDKYYIYNSKFQFFMFS